MNVRFTSRFALIAAALLGFALWLAAVGPLRTWASSAGVRDVWVFGVAPSLFAGWTLTCWQALGTGSGPAVSAGLAVALLALAEAVQVVHPRQTPDLWDLAAGAVGALLGSLAVRWARPTVPSRTP